MPFRQFLHSVCDGRLSVARHIRQSTNPTMRLGHPSMNHTQQQQQSQLHHGHLSPKQQQHHHHAQQASQQQCQVIAAGHAHHGAGGGGGGAAHGGPRPSPSEHFICIELQKLHKEKERLQHQQEAINCRVYNPEIVCRSALSLYFAHSAKYNAEFAGVILFMLLFYWSLSSRRTIMSRWHYVGEGAIRPGFFEWKSDRQKEK